MFELILRVVLASGAMAASGVLGRPDFDLAWRTALVFAAYSYLLYLMEQKGARNAGVSGLAAVADCGVLAVVLGDLGLLADFGSAAALPMVLAYFRHKANAAMMAPLVASWLLIGANLFGGGNAFTPGLLLHALGVLVVGVVLSTLRTARENRRVREVPIPDVDKTLQILNQHAAQPKPEEPAEESDTVTVDAREYADFRESFRALTDSARDLERRGRKDRACVQLFEGVARLPLQPFTAIATKIQDLTGAEGVGIYTVSQAGDAMTVRSTAGHVEQSVHEASIELPKRATDAEIADQAAAMIASVCDPMSRTRFANVVLKLRGKVIGLLALFHSDKIELETGVRRAKETSDFLAELVADCLAREDERRRLREAELLYTVATTTIGATTPHSLASRVARDLYQGVALDHVSVWSLEHGVSAQLASEGTDLTIIEHVTFAQGKGIDGWLRSGAPVLSVADARNDARVPSQEAVRRRVGSLLVVPLEFGSEPFGFLVASTSRTGGIGTGETETVRAVCAETSQALARMQAGSTGPEGLATPQEFYAIVRQSTGGHLVYLEVPQREEMNETYGKPAVEHAVRRFAVRLRSELPAGSAVTRRNEGDYVAFIPSTDESYVRRWANDATALASLVGVRTPDGRTRIPLALRAKVAPLNQQIHRISQERVA